MIHKHICRNGVRIIHERSPHVHSLSVGVWIQAGSQDEKEEEAGLAHFIEHMLFKGTKKYSAKQIAEHFDRIGGELNAFTSKEATCYHARVLKEDAEEALELLADMLVNSQFDAHEMTKEKQVILEEIAMYEDTPDDEVHEQLWQTMYAKDPIGKPVLGNHTSVLSFTKEAVQKFMKRLYQPERIVVSIAGNYDDSLIHFIEELFGSLQSSEQKKVLRAQRVPIFHAENKVLNKEIEQAHLCIGFPSLTVRDERKYALAIVDHIIGGAMSSRLFQEVREQQGLAYSIFSYYACHERTGAFMIYGGTGPENLEKLQQTIANVLQEAIAKGVTQQEIRDAKQSIKSNFLLGLESAESRMLRNGQQELLGQLHLTADEVIDKISRVEQTEVELLMQEIFQQPFASSVICP